jgi:hypothetical protein
LDRAHIKEYVQLPSGSKWSEEALGRAPFHLSRIYREQGVQPDEASKFEQDALKVLEQHPTNTPDFLLDVEDKMLIFDDLQPA